MQAECLYYDVTADGAFVHDQLQRSLERAELVVPLLPEVAVRVVRMGAKLSTSAHQLSDLIETDAALSRYVLRIAASAGHRPATPIASLPHAVAWLGFDEVANIAFTLALQARMLDVPGQQPRARRLWRHALASALWARQIAGLLAEESGASYLCGLLHDIGRVITLGAVNDITRMADKRLAARDYERLIEAFHREIGARVVTAWRLPPSVLTVITHWQDRPTKGAARLECAIVNVAHRLADFSLFETTPQVRDVLVTDPAYRELGLDLEDDNPLLASAAGISAELDRYLAP